VDALYASQHEAQRSRFAAFYSSELGGIVTDPAFWVVQLDDHMVHRGHAVFDTAMLVEGHLYQLDQHLARFLTSAAKASIPLPAGMSVEQMKRTILETAAASCKLNGAPQFSLKMAALRCCVAAAVFGGTRRRRVFSRRSASGQPGLQFSATHAAAPPPAPHGSSPRLCALLAVGGARQLQPQRQQLPGIRLLLRSLHRPSARREAGRCAAGSRCASHLLKGQGRCSCSAAG
jgi:hypothetical protein